MKLDRELIRDIKKQANGDGSRKVKMAFLKRVRDTKKALSTPDVMLGGFDAAIKEYGRVPVAICTAATLWQRKERIDILKIDWAMEVLIGWNNRTNSTIEIAAIDDGLHPTRICGYAGDFIRLTTEG